MGVSVMPAMDGDAPSKSYADFSKRDAQWICARRLSSSSENRPFTLMTDCYRSRIVIQRGERVADPTLVRIFIGASYVNAQ
jgi:hypothetical protein